MTWFFPEDFRDPSSLLEDRLSHLYKLELVSWRKADRKIKDACKKIATSLIFDRDDIDWDDDCNPTLEETDVPLRKIIRPAAVGIAVCLLISVVKANLDNHDHRYDDATESTTNDTSAIQDAQSIPLAPQDRAVMSDAEWAKYAKVMQKRVMSNWRVPGSIRSISATVSFDLATTGHFSNLKMSRSSGNKTFDKSCMEAMRKSQPLAPLPDGAESLSDCEFDFCNDGH